MKESVMSDRPVSQTVRAQIMLRDMILSGQFRPSERIAELQAVEATGVSRTSVRMALVRLEEEGLLEDIPSGGFMVRSFSESEVLDTIEVRGTIEGLAARFAAERGVSARDMAPIRDTLAEIDALLQDDHPSADLMSSYALLNGRFHAFLSDLSGSRPVVQMVERVSALPFASPSAFFRSQLPPAELRQVLLIAQDHHRVLAEAIENREGARAESVMREHARLTARNLRHVLSQGADINTLPRMALAPSLHEA